MLRTKLAIKVLKKAEQKHLTAFNIHSMKTFREARHHQLGAVKANVSWRTCQDCQVIARKLGVD